MRRYPGPCSRIRLIVTFELSTISAVVEAFTVPPWIVSGRVIVTGVEIA